MENKHTASDLKQMQKYPLEMKVALSKMRIRGWINEYGTEGTYISFSGGKDSLVLRHLVKEDYPDVPTVFVNTGLEHNSVRQKGMELADEVLLPKENFIQVLTKYGYPCISKECAHKLADYRSAEKNGHVQDSYIARQFEGTYVSKNGKTNMMDIQKYKYLLDSPFRISHKCCDVMKKMPVKQYEHETGRHPFIGTMADESLLRMKKWIKFGCNAFEQERPTSQPLSFWTEQDILRYIKENNLKTAEAYGEIMYCDSEGFFYKNPIITDGLKLKTTGCQRTGCTFCLFGANYDNRFLLLKESDPQKYDFIMRGGCFDEEGMWVPGKDENGVFGLGFKFVIDWLNAHGNTIKY